MDQHKYIFVDEGGDLNFSDTGTMYFTLTSVTTTRPFNFDLKLSELRYDLIEDELNLEYFHASEDKQIVRNMVFSIIQSHSSAMRVDSIIIEKRKTSSILREDKRFFPEMLGYLLRYSIEGLSLKGFSGKIIVITDRIPIKKKRNAIEKGIKVTLSRMLPSSASYNVYHHQSKSCIGLQVADYINWAIFRKWERKDTRSYNIIKKVIKSEFNIFEKGTKLWY